MLLFFALIMNESNNYEGVICPNEGDLSNKLMICEQQLFILQEVSFYGMV